jgi:HSP20 family molecular chaperone IbpA
MTMRDLIPWNRGRDMAVRRGEDNPFLTLHREMNRLFDDVFRGFDLSPFGSDRFFDRIAGNWPRVEVSETDKEIEVTAELPGLDERDVRVELANGVLAIAGEKKTEIEDKERLRPFRTTHSGRGCGRGQGIRRVQERSADCHAAEDRASAVEGETHHHQWQISRNESSTLPFRRISGGHEHCERSHLR